MKHLLFCLLVCSLCACQTLRFREAAENVLEKKAEPYDHFSFQRTYPDTVFDWASWRQALQRMKEAETKVVERDGCSGSPTKWTLQGPSNVAGRVNTLAVKPNDENTVLAGFATGGIFKSTDGCATWKPVFDEQPELAIGHLAFDPSNPDVVYAGTGDVNMPSQVYNGYGIYKSTDAGDSWNYLGLGAQGIVSRIVVDPTNPQVLYAAVNGNPFVRNDQRGVFKSVNGGQSWQRIHFVSTQAGASDLVINPQNPQILYASYWDRIRSNTESTIYGPNAKVFKTTNGGASWVQLGGGLPTGIMGRTGLAISQQNPDKLYAVFVDTLSRPGGLYKTTDGGASWTSLNINGVADTYGGFGWYFGKVDLNPTNDEEVYFHGILLWRKPAGSTGWSVASGGHSDSHDLIWTSSGRRYWANDGGVYRNNANSATWTKSLNLPATQFYHTDYNPHTPNIYWGGAQDNGILKGSGGASINNWASPFSADGFHCAFGPSNPQTFWVETQNGAIHRTLDGGNSWQQGNTCLGTTDRCNWDTPFFISRHSPYTLYAATYRAYSSSDGTGWGVASGDLTDGIVFESRFHTISTFAESPLQAGKLVAGTSDGNVWWRTPAGAWTNVTPGLPNRYVTSVQASPSSATRLFTTHSGIKYNEDIPHVHRSDNNGQTWINISGDLPKIPVNDLLVLPGHADSVLFAATDGGVYFTLSRGQHWERLGSNLPYVVVSDLDQNPARKELVAATFGRGIWTFPLDSIFTQPGKLTTTISGTLKTESGASIGDVQMRQTPPSFTNTLGRYTLTGVPGCQTYEITPYRNDSPLNGVTTYDLVLISKHILGLEPITSPYSLIACDANQSNSITTYDIVLLRRLILGIDTVFSDNTSWRFVPKSHLFPDPGNPFKTAFPEKIAVPVGTSPATDADFTGIKIGDLNNSVVPHLQGSADDRTDGEWPLFLSEKNFVAGERITVPFSASLANVSGAQWTLHFDASRLTLEKIEPLLESITQDNFNLRKADEGLVSLSFENMSVFQKTGGAEASTLAQPLFQWVFRTKMEGSTAHAFQLLPSPTLPLAFQPDGTALEPVLRSLPSEEDDLALWPNPFGSSGVWLRLPKAFQGDFVVQIFDAQGKTLFEKSIHIEMGSQPFLLPPSIFPSAGAYIYRVSGARTWTGKLLRN